MFAVDRKVALVLVPCHVAAAEPDARAGKNRPLFEVAEEMDTEDGQIWVVGVNEDTVMAFTDDGIDNLKKLIEIHKDNPSLIKDRHKTLAAAVNPNTEETNDD